MPKPKKKRNAFGFGLFGRGGKFSTSQTYRVKRVSGGTAKSKVHKSEAGTDRLFDDIAKGLGGKSYASLSPGGQATVRKVAAKMNPYYAVTRHIKLAKHTGKVSRVFKAKDRADANKKIQRLATMTGKDYHVYGPLSKNPKRPTTVPATLIVRDGKVKVFVSPAVMRKMNPHHGSGGWLDSAFQAGQQWGRTGQHTSGVANARVRRYGFIKFFNNIPPREPLQVTKGRLEKAFNEGFKIGKKG